MKERGNGRTILRGGYWYAGFYEPGKKHETRIASRSKRRADAVSLLKEHIRQIANARAGEGPYIGPAKARITFGELLDDLSRVSAAKKSARTIGIRISQLRPRFGGRRAMSITKTDLLSYADELQSAGKAPATIDRVMEVACRAFRLGVENGKLAKAPKMPERRCAMHSNARQGFLEPEDSLALLVEIEDPDFRDFVDWYGTTGMRGGETASLSWPDFDGETLKLQANNAKTGKARVLPIVGPLAPIIKRRLAARRLGCDLVFHFDGKPFHQAKGGLPDWCYGQFRKAAKAIGKPNLLPYDLRRSAVRNLLRAGVDPHVVKKISGHRTDSMLERYDIVSSRDTAAAFGALETYVATRTK